MHKTLRLLALTLLLSLLVSTAGALPEMTAFTHPEVGEYLVTKFPNGMPFFTVYDFPYYVVMDPTVPHRGLQANFTTLPNKNMVDLDKALTLFFESVDSPENTETLVYTGRDEVYADALEALPIPERVKAIRLLNGCDGIKGYEQLAAIPGFEGVDVAALSASHLDYTVQVGKDSLPLRVLTFVFEGDDWLVYTERYSFLQVGKTWKLSRMVQEFTEDYMARGLYTHGVAGSDPVHIQPTALTILRESPLGSSQADVEAREGIQAQDGKLVVPETGIFALPTQATFTFREGKLTQLQYQLTGAEAYVAAFVSLYTRLSDPITLDKEGNMSWSLNDLFIDLQYDQAAPTLTITAR